MEAFMACTKDVGCSCNLLTREWWQTPNWRDSSQLRAQLLVQDVWERTAFLHVFLRQVVACTARGVSTESSLGWLVLHVWFIVLFVACLWLEGSKTSLGRLRTSAKVLSQPDNSRRLTWTSAEGGLGDSDLPSEVGISQHVAADFSVCLWTLADSGFWLASLTGIVEVPCCWEVSWTELYKRFVLRVPQVDSSLQMQMWAVLEAFFDWIFAFSFKPWLSSSSGMVQKFV